MISALQKGLFSIPSGLTLSWKYPYVQSHSLDQTIYPTVIILVSKFMSQEYAAYSGVENRDEGPSSGVHERILLGGRMRMVH